MGADAKLEKNSECQYVIKYIYVYIYLKIINHICYKNTIIKKCNQCAIFYSFTTNLKVFPTTKAFLHIFVALKS